MDKLLSLAPFSSKLEDFTLITLRGNDAVSYLNSQTTNNVLKLDEKSFETGALLDISGRLISFFLCFKVKNGISLLVPSNLLEQTKTRIEKYHISEDFELIEETKDIFVNFNTVEGDYKGHLASLACSLSFSCVEADLVNFEEISILAGFPILNKSIFENDLINNTLLINYAVAFDKGCYPGQETVAKIHSRRGAATTVMYLEGDFDLKDLDKKVGSYYLSFVYNSRKYILCSLKRDFALDKKKLLLEDNEFIVRAYPLITNDTLITTCFYKAVEYFQKEKEQLAIDLLKRVITLCPSYSDAYESLGVIYGRQNRFQEAIDLMHKLEEIEPNSVMAQTNLSMFYMKVGDIEKAEKHKGEATFKQFLKLGEDAEEEKKKEEQKQLEKQELDRKKKMFLQVLEIDAEDALASHGLAQIYIEENKLEEAEKLLLIAIKSDPKYSVAYLALAKLYNQLDRKVDLKNILELGIAVATKNGDLMPANEMQAMFVNLS